MARSEANQKAHREARAVTTINVEPRRNRNIRYTPELALMICDKMIEEGSLKEACRRYFDEFPDYVTILGWVSRYPDFELIYVRARERLMERWSEDIIETAYDSTLDANERRVIIDTKKWLMSKIAHRRYGDKLQVSGDSENPIVVLHKHVDEIMQEMSPAQLDALEQLALSMGNAVDVEEDKT